MFACLLGETKDKNCRNIRVPLGAECLPALLSEAKEGRDHNP